MIKTYLKRAFQLSDSGVKGLAKSIWSFFLYYVSFVPPMICVFLFADRLLNGNAGKPVVYLLFMLAATLVMYLVININYKTTYDETYQESANLRIDLAEQLSKLPLSYFSKHNLSDLAQTIMADVASIEHAFANAVANSIGFAIYFLVISVALLIMNWKLGLCVLLPVLTSASVLFLTKKLQVRDVNKHYDKLRDISESFQNAIELNQEIKSYGLKEKVEAQMDQQLDESENLQWKAQITQTIPVTIGQTLSILPIGITATVGLSMLASGQVSILILLGYIIMAAKLSGAMGGVLLYLTEIFYLDARIARIGEIKNHELQGGEKAVLSDFNVEIKDVCFSYQKDTQVIRHASFTAEQGQVTALVGPSGCGKTTMLKLISRLYDADSGTVQIGGTDIREIHTDSLFKYVSIVFQEVILFNTSIMENIRLGRLDASDEEVIRAAKLAGCNEFVSRLPDTYQTIIGENGAKLSGGERQRLSIARAILKDAPIIILDEIAASLDVETEVQIQTGLNHLIQGKTVIVISHRLKSIENADKIVVMKAGMVEACGKHAHLLKQSPTYRKMIEKSNLAEKFNY
jgi:ATP-binding cassette subfamily B protein IrtB